MGEGWALQLQAFMLVAKGGMKKKMKKINSRRDRTAFIN